MKDKNLFISLLKYLSFALLIAIITYFLLKFFYPQKIYLPPNEMRYALIELFRTL